MSPTPDAGMTALAQRDELNKYQLPLIIICLGIVSAIFAFIFMLNINTRELEKEFSGDSKLQINTFKDWLSSNINEVEKLSRYISVVDPASEEKLFHVLVNQNVGQDVFEGVYLIGSSDNTHKSLNVLSAVGQENPEKLLLQPGLKAEITESLKTQNPLATDPVVFSNGAKKGSKVAIIFPILRHKEAKEVLVAILDPSLRFEEMKRDHNASNSDKYIFDMHEDGSEQMFYGDPLTFTSKAALHYKYSDPEIVENTSAFFYTETIPVLSRQWKFVFVPTYRYIAKANTPAAWIVMVCCLVLTTVTGAFLFHLIGQNVRTETTVRERTKELIEASIELKAAKELAEAANRAKSDFLANVSHEIRTPLSSMIGLTELVLEGKLDGQQENNIRTVLNSGEVLMQLINDMLDFSKIESGKLELDPTTFDLQAVLQDTVDLFSAKVREKEHTLQLILSVTSATPHYVVGDSIRIRQILSNLINNAIKFTPKGQIVVTAEKLEDKAPSGSFNIKISVQDSGIGIPPDRLQAIFEKFTQVDSSTTRKFGGTGLGLSICKELVEMMQGKILAESTYGKGSTFSVILPLKLATHTHKQESAAKAPIGDNTQNRNSEEQAAHEDNHFMEGAQILLVEDNRPNRDLGLKLLENFSCAAIAVTNGEEAVEIVKNRTFDLILMDCQMPEMDGFEASSILRQMKNQGEIADIPIIALTANALKGDKERCLESGMNDYLTKPLRKVALREILMRWLPPKDKRFSSTLKQ